MNFKVVMRLFLPYDAEDITENNMINDALAWYADPLKCISG